jgi:hypothetical protein
MGSDEHAACGLRFDFASSSVSSNPDNVPTRNATSQQAEDTQRLIGLLAILRSKSEELCEVCHSRQKIIDFNIQIFNL